LCKSSKQRQSKIEEKDPLQANELMIAVTFALPAESSAFLRRLGNKSRSHRQGIKTIRGKIDDRTIEVLHTGVGEKTCRQRMASFLQDRQFDCLISAGFAGALNDELHAGDLLFAENFSTVQLNEMRSGLGSSLIHRANLLTVSSIIDSIEERQKIAQTTGAAAADMETEFIARGCAEHGVPLLSLRVISDTPSEPFPGPSKILFDVERQRTNATKLSLHLLRHPTVIPRWILFARRIARARRTLANALLEVVHAIA
jgi:nucleoside phosphorylase